jgi:hypothetical protein
VYYRGKRNLLRRVDADGHHDRPSARPQHSLVRVQKGDGFCATRSTRCDVSYAHNDHREKSVRVGAPISRTRVRQNESILQI